MSLKDTIDAAIILAEQRLEAGDSRLAHTVMLLRAAAELDATRLQQLGLVAGVASSLADTLSVDTIKEDVRQSKLPELARLHSGLNGIKEEFGDTKTKIQKVFDWLRISHMPERMEADGLESFTVEGVGRVYLSSSLNASIKADSKEGAYLYLTDNGHGGIIGTTVNASSLKALAKKKIKDGDPLPPELFNVTPVTQVVIQKK